MGEFGEGAGAEGYEARRDRQRAYAERYEREHPRPPSDGERQHAAQAVEREIKEGAARYDEFRKDSRLSAEEMNRRQELSDELWDAERRERERRLLSGE